MAFSPLVRLLSNQIDNSFDQRLMRIMNDVDPVNTQMPVGQESNLIDQVASASTNQANTAAQNSGGKIARPRGALGRGIAGSVAPRVTPSK